MRSMPLRSSSGPTSLSRTPAIRSRRNCSDDHRHQPAERRPQEDGLRDRQARRAAGSRQPHRCRARTAPSSDRARSAPARGSRRRSRASRRHSARRHSRSRASSASGREASARAADRSGRHSRGNGASARRGWSSNGLPRLRPKRGGVRRGHRALSPSCAEPGHGSSPRPRPSAARCLEYRPPPG